MAIKPIGLDKLPIEQIKQKLIEKRKLKLFCFVFIEGPENNYIFECFDSEENFKIFLKQGEYTFEFLNHDFDTIASVSLFNERDRDFDSRQAGILFANLLS